MTQEQINSLLAKPETKSCTWTEDADGNWNTGCQEIHVFISGTPHENGYVYCPYCGGKIEAESDNIAEDNVRLHDLLYCVKHACIELRDNPDQVSISDVLSIFNEYEDVLPGKDSPYPIHNED
jgi:hypothetical protein